MSREDEIRQIAFELWEQENRPEGRAEEHWTRAEQIWEDRQRQKVAASVPERPAPKRPLLRRRRK